MTTRKHETRLLQRLDATAAKLSRNRAARRVLRATKRALAASTFSVGRHGEVNYRDDGRRGAEVRP
jgi:hypothetical protein